MSANDVIFAQAFGGALEHSGISLNELSRLLAAEGLAVSSATLSYWRKGVRNPGRRSSVEVVRAIERILDVESGSLVAHAMGARARGRGVRTIPLWVGDQAISKRMHQLLDELGMSTEPTPMSLIVHEHVYLDYRARRRWTQVTQVLRATDGPITSFYIGQEGTRSNDGPMRLADLSIGEVAAVAMDRSKRLLLMRIDLPAPLREGDTLRVDYALDFPHVSGKTHFHDRWLTRSLREYVLNVHFDSAYQAAEAESYVGGEDAKPDVLLAGHRVPISRGFAQCVLLDLAPGIAGMRWRFPDEEELSVAYRVSPPEGTAADEAWRTIRGLADVVA